MKRGKGGARVSIEWTRETTWLSADDHCRFTDISFATHSVLCIGVNAVCSLRREFPWMQ